MSDAGILAAARRALRRHPSATTVTVTRVTGTPAGTQEPAVPDTVVVTTEEPAQPPASHRLAHAAMVVASVALAVALSGIAYRTWKE